MGSQLKLRLWRSMLMSKSLKNIGTCFTCRERFDVPAPEGRNIGSAVPMLAGPGKDFDPDLSGPRNHRTTEQIKKGAL